MLDQNLPLIVEPKQLFDALEQNNLLIVDLCAYSDGHIPTSVPLSYSNIIAGKPPVMGLVPESEGISQALSSIGMTENSHVVAYDNEGNGKAARLLYTLDCIGHSKHSLLNGGLDAWIDSNLPLDDRSREATVTDYKATLSDGPIATMAYILEHLEDPMVQLLDTRSADEYHGKSLRAAQGGHIPGAKHLEWTDLFDANNARRLKRPDEIKALLQRQGIDFDNEIIVYCQTHHRSAHSYIALKSLGLNVKGYPGAWSEWGNAENVPIER